LKDILPILLPMLICWFVFSTEEEDGEGEDGEEGGEEEEEEDEA